MGFIKLAVEAVGTVALSGALLLTMWAAYRLYGRQPTNPKVYGSWALVTGCGAGMGKEYAKQLAKAGMNLVLVSLLQSELDTLHKELQEYGIETRMITMDLSDLSSDKWL